MKFTTTLLSTVAALAFAGVSAHAVTTHHSNTIRVESPATDPTLEQPGAEAMYLYRNNVGQTLLYIESSHGRRLAILNVTDPAAIRRVAETELPVPSGYDFVRPIGDHMVLIRYRRSGEVATLCLTQSRHPELERAFAPENANVQQTLGQTALLISKEPTGQNPFRDPQNYEVVDTLSATHPAVLASIAEVTERVSNPDTGTLFLLNGNGVTVVRRLRIEADHQMELDLDRP
jgi:hypothetical protein